MSSTDIDDSEENELEEEEIKDENLSLKSIKKTIRIIHTLTKNVYERLIKTQENLQKITALSNQWKNMPLYTREKNSKFITFGDHLAEIKATRCTEMREASKKIRQLLKEDCLLFHNVPLIDPDLGIFMLIYLF